MGKRDAIEIAGKNSADGKLVCIGLDTDPTKIPQHLNTGGPPTDGMHKFNKSIAEATGDITGAFKPNLAFYLEQGAEGILCLKHTIQFIQHAFPSVLVIVDGKTGDIGNTNEKYASFLFDYLGADAVTLNPYLGWKAMKPFLDRKDKINIILDRTSNEGSDELQNFGLSGPPLNTKGEYLYRQLAQNIADKTMWNYNGNTALVFGATQAEEMKSLRSIIGNTVFTLIPGVGEQGGNLEKSVEYGMNKTGGGIWINNSRAIIYASNGTDYADASRIKALEMHNAILKKRKELLGAA